METFQLLVPEEGPAASDPHRPADARLAPAVCPHGPGARKRLRRPRHKSTYSGGPGSVAAVRHRPLPQANGPDSAGLQGTGGETEGKSRGGVTVNSPGPGAGSLPWRTVGADSPGPREASPQREGDGAGSALSPRGRVPRGEPWLYPGRKSISRLGFVRKRKEVRWLVVGWFFFFPQIQKSFTKQLPKKLAGAGEGGRTELSLQNSSPRYR